MYAKRYEEAVVWLKKVPSSWLLAYSYVFMGRCKEAFAVLESNPELISANPNDCPDGSLAYAYAVCGRLDEALRMRNQLEACARQGPVNSYSAAMLYAGLGDNDEAIAQLRKGIELRAPIMIQINIEPFFDKLHSDPRWKELLNSIRYPGTGS